MLDLVETNFGFEIVVPTQDGKEEKKDEVQGESSAMKQNDSIKSQLLKGRSKLFNNE